MKTILKSLMFVASALALPVASHAVTPWTFGAGDEGSIANLTFNGIVEGDVIAGLSSTMSLKFVDVSDDLKAWDFDLVALNNTSGPLPITSRLVSFGFNTLNGDTLISPTASNVTGMFDLASADSGNIPQLGTFSICFRDAGGNCAGGGDGGLFPTDPAATGSFRLSFSDSVSSLTLNNFFTRYQSIEGVEQGTSGVGRATTVLIFDPSGGVVPEPASWAMLIAGFGLVGATMRRRRTMRGVVA
jgi:hypothetical protein